MSTYTLTGGVTLTLQRPRPLFIGRIIAATREQWIAEHGDVPPVPTYSVETLSGETEVHEHDSTTLDEHPDDREAWEAYTQARTGLAEAVQLASLRACLIYGILEEPDEGWKKEREYWHIPVPEHPHEAKIEWLEDLSAGWPELLQIALRIQMLPSPVEDIARGMIDLFRGKVGQSDRADDPGPGAEAPTAKE